MRPAPCGYAARRRRKKIKLFFRRRVRRKNTLRGASVAGPARGRGASAANPLWRKRRQPFSTVLGRRKIFAALWADRPGTGPCCPVPKRPSVHLLHVAHVVESAQGLDDLPVGLVGL